MSHCVGMFFGNFGRSCTGVYEYCLPFFTGLDILDELFIGGKCVVELVHYTIFEAAVDGISDELVGVEALF